VVRENGVVLWNGLVIPRFAVNQFGPAIVLGWIIYCLLLRDIADQ
jgi:hypothetical protein